MNPWNHPHDTVQNVIQSPYILYVEGEDDERLLNALASILETEEILNKFCFQKMGGISKDNMKNLADSHFQSLTQIVTGVKRIVLFDYDTENSFHPEPGNAVLFEWQRKNIENYLLVPDAWIRAIHTKFNRPEDDLFYSEIVDNFFNEQNLSLPKGSSWRDIKANIFKVIDGKKILFEQEDSLFQRIWEIEQLVMNREAIPCFPFIFTPNSINSILAIYPHPLQALLLRLADPGRTG